MSEKFPVLKNNEVALVRAQINTGHVLDENLKLATLEGQKIYTIFDSLKESIRYAKQLTSENGKVECNIYGNRNNFILRIPA